MEAFKPLATLVLRVRRAQPVQPDHRVALLDLADHQEELVVRVDLGLREDLVVLEG